MTSTPWVYPACHSFSHANIQLTKDLNKEIVEAKKVLEERLLMPIDTFVYPYGKFDAQAKKEVKRHYSYQFRIGSSINFSWKNLTGLTYRIPMDQKTKIPSKNYVFKWIWHSLRGR